MNMNATATPTPAAQWGPARAFRDRLAAHEASQSTGASVDQLEAMTDKVVAARDLMFATPAPNHAALLEKLRVIFEADADNGFTAEWSRAYIGETLADMERLLAPKAEFAEMDARDREGVIFCYLETLFRNMREDLQTATTGTIARGSSESIAAEDAFNQLDIAQDYLDELRRLAGRPIA